MPNQLNYLELQYFAVLQLVFLQLVNSLELTYQTRDPITQPSRTGASGVFFTLTSRWRTLASTANILKLKLTLGKFQEKIEI